MRKFENICYCDIQHPRHYLDIYLPDNVNVKLKSTALFGGADDKRRFEDLPGAPTVYVSSLCLFGGVDIK